MSHQLHHILEHLDNLLKQKNPSTASTSRLEASSLSRTFLVAQTAALKQLCQVSSSSNSNSSGEGMSYKCIGRLSGVDLKQCIRFLLVGWNNDVIMDSVSVLEVEYGLLCLILYALQSSSSTSTSQEELISYITREYSTHSFLTYVSFRTMTLCRQWCSLKGSSDSTLVPCMIQRQLLILYKLILLVLEWKHPSPMILLQLAKPVSHIPSTLVPVAKEHLFTWFTTQWKITEHPEIACYQCEVLVVLTRNTRKAVKVLANLCISALFTIYPLVLSPYKNTSVVFDSSTKRKLVPSAVVTSTSITSNVTNNSSQQAMVSHIGTHRFLNHEYHHIQFFLLSSFSLMKSMEKRFCLLDTLVLWMHDILISVQEKAEEEEEMANKMAVDGEHLVLKNLSIHTWNIYYEATFLCMMHAMAWIAPSSFKNNKTNDPYADIDIVLLLFRRIIRLYNKAEEDSICISQSR